jgi:quaternary ammonium compound-resistance protein SugE
MGWRASPTGVGVSDAMAWVALVLAGLFECGWAVGLKFVDGLKHPWALCGVALAMGASFGLLTFALRTLPVGTAYAVWTGIGAAGTAVLGIILFQEPATAWRVACLALVVAGLVGLKLAS